LTWHHHHVLDLDDFSREEIEAVLETASAMKEVLTRPVPKVPTLRGKRVFGLFYEPSTRTRASFELAAKTLSAEVVGITAQASSVAKGESLLDTIKTLEALGADAIVLRHPEAGAPYLAARYCRASIVNAGDGAHAHPTQALLDLFSLRQRLGDLELRILTTSVLGLAHYLVAEFEQVVELATDNLAALPADWVYKSIGGSEPDVCRSGGPEARRRTAYSIMRKSK